MFTDKDGDLTLTGGLSITTIILILIAAVIVLCLWGCPLYAVYASRKTGEAALAHAQSSKEVAVAEAKAKMESALYNAQADTIRAHGIARSNEIIGSSLKDNQAYLQWLWIDQLKDQQHEIIYVPSSNLGLPLLEASRLKQ